MANRKRVLKLWAINPRCYWCKTLTVLSPEGISTTNPDTATFDHLYTKLDPMRKTEYGHMGVLACYKCNCDRGRTEFLQHHPLAAEMQYGAIA